MAQHQPLLVRKQFHDNNRSIEDAMLVNLASGGKKHATPWREARVAPAIRPFVLMPEVWELNTNRAIPTVDPARRQLDFEMTAHGDLLLSLTFRVKAPAPFPTATSATKDNGLITYPPSLVLSLIHRAEMWVGRTLVERLEPEYIHLWQRLALRNPPVEAQGRVGDETPHDGKPVDQYVVLPFFFHRGQCPLPIQKIRDNCGGRLGGAEGGIRLRIFLRDLAQICPSLSKDPGTLAPPELATSYDDFEFQVIGKTALLGDDEARHVRKAEFAAVVPHVQSLHHDEEGSTMRPSHQITELPLRVERPLTRLLWAVRDKQVMPDSQGSHTYAQGVRTLAGPPIQPELGDFNKARVGTISRNETVAGRQPGQVTIESGELTIEATDLEYRYIDQFFPESGTDGQGIAEIGQNHTKMNLFDDLVNSQLIVLAQDNGGTNVEVGASQPIEIIFRPSDSSAVEPITEVVLTNYEVDYGSTPDDMFTSDVHDLSVSWRLLGAATKISAKKTNDAGYTVLVNGGVDTSNDIGGQTLTTELITTFTFVNTTKYDEYKITIEANYGGAEYFDPQDPTAVDENILGKDGIFLSLLEMKDTNGNVIVGRTNVPDEDEIEILGGEETFGFNATALSSLSNTALDVIIDGDSSDPTSHLGVRTADGTFTLKYTPNAPKSIEQVRLNSLVPGSLQRYATYVPVLDKVYGVKDGDKNEIIANLSNLNPATLVYDLETVDSHDSYEFEMKSGATVAIGEQNYYDIVYPIENPETSLINFVEVLNQSYLGEFELIEAAGPDVTFATPVDVATSRLDMGPGSLHLWGDRFDFRTTDAQGNELVDPLEHVQLKLDAQDRLPDDSNMRVAYYRLVDPHEHASRSQGQQPGAYSYTFARDADSLSREGPERAVTGSINLARIHDKVLRLKHRVPGRDAVLFAWAECLDVFELGGGLGSYGMRHA